MTAAQVGVIPTTLPPVVVGQADLTQSLKGPLEDGSANTRGLVALTPGPIYFSNATQVLLALLGSAECVSCMHSSEHRRCCCRRWRWAPRRPPAQLQPAAEMLCWQ
jgi:hypothetical protein